MCVCVLGFYLRELLEAESEGIWCGGGVGPAGPCWGLLCGHAVSTNGPQLLSPQCSPCWQSLHPGCVVGTASGGRGDPGLLPTFDRHAWRRGIRSPGSQGQRSKVTGLEAAGHLVSGLLGAGRPGSAALSVVPPGSYRLGGCLSISGGALREGVLCGRGGGWGGLGETRVCG